MENEVNTEADSNDMTECSDDDKRGICMLDLYCYTVSFLDVGCM